MPRAALLAFVVIAAVGASAVAQEPTYTLVIKDHQVPAGRNRDPRRQKNRLARQKRRSDPGGIRKHRAEAREGDARRRTDHRVYRPGETRDVRVLRGFQPEDRARPHHCEIGRGTRCSAAAIIVFREVLEAALIVGIVMAASAGAPRRGFWVSIGLAGALSVPALSLFSPPRSPRQPPASARNYERDDPLFAVAMLGWHNIWMSRHGRELAATARRSATL